MMETLMNVKHFGEECASGILFKHTKIPTEIINMIMEYIIKPNKQIKKNDNLRTLEYNLRNQSVLAVGVFVSQERRAYLKTLWKKINHMLYYPYLIEHNTKYMSIREHLNNMEISGLDKHRILSIINKYNKSNDKNKTLYYFEQPHETIKHLTYKKHNDRKLIGEEVDFNKRLKNIDATYKVIADDYMDSNKSKIMRGIILKYYNIDAFQQKRYRTLRTEIRRHHQIKNYMEQMDEIIRFGRETFNTDEYYDFYPIIYYKSELYRGTDCVNNFKDFEIINETKNYWNIRVIYKVDDNNNITINEKVKINNIWECLLKNKEIEKNHYYSILPFQHSLRSYDCLTLDMDKINKKYNLNIDMKHWKKCYGSKYAYITPSRNVDKLSMMFMSNNWKQLNPKIFKKFQNKYFK